MKSGVTGVTVFFYNCKDVHQLCSYIKTMYINCAAILRGVILLYNSCTSLVQIMCSYNKIL